MTCDVPTVHRGKAAPSKSMAATAQELFSAPNPQYLNAIAIAASQAIADTGATSIYHGRNTVEKPPTSHTPTHHQSTGRNKGKVNPYV